MARPEKAEKVGRGKCPTCSGPLLFKRSGGGLLRYACDGCDTSGYAQVGSVGEAKWLATIEGAPAPAAPAPAPVAAPVPPGKKKTGFALGGL